MMTSVRVLGQLWGFLKERKKWWLLPIVLVLLVVGVALVLAETSVLGPLIYPIF